jgi:cytochrome P450
VVKPIEVGGITYEPGVVLFASAYLVQHDPSIYDEPYAFRPERFLERPPGTYTWIPFGGGRRRCIGASFAMLEMKTVLRALARRFEIRPAQALPEIARRRGISISPGRGCVVVLSERTGRATRASAREEPAAALA